MPTKLAIPDLAIALDFMGEDYQEARVELSNKIINDTLAAMSLVNLWVISNNKDKLAWAQQVEEENLVAEKKSQRLSEDIATQQKCLADKQDSAWQEERKRNKLKYAPVKDIDVPSDPIIIPSQYATQKIENESW
ncbi:hypothetical protein SERLADRAFT_443767 [Serpula lacrymans var. lacrymans S7.9]|uniref:Uncharacterized protein n=1 Tax=Serpula lacrymans var. lacrymans (strain S7.9) TaxID=578457 RepID=F8PDH5_SERL9|nr:uncharacterized protein SERLADRAFT_443767 [Serpula lacrymans var. lacrymans S7.9]EGO18796.1 hypothetical protein SERLADRAFT_443767 [Serpula lacrymans var. lacrymans S7.9]